MCPCRAQPNDRTESQSLFVRHFDESKLRWQDQRYSRYRQMNPGILKGGRSESKPCTFACIFFYLPPEPCFPPKRTNLLVLGTIKSRDEMDEFLDWGDTWFTVSKWVAIPHCWKTATDSDCFPRFWRCVESIHGRHGHIGVPGVDQCSWSCS